MSDCELKSSAQWGENLIPTLNNIFIKLSEKIDSVNESINAIKDDLINKIDNAQKTAETNEVAEGLKEEFNQVRYHCENLKAENLRLKNTIIPWKITAERVI